MHIYSIKNEKLSYFNRPIYTESFNEALSYLQNVLMSDADRALIGLKDDLALYYLGTIDFTDGVICGVKHPKKICDLREIFDSIPDDKVPQTANALYHMIDELVKRVHALENPPEEVSADDVCESE